jgi:hypothetical protein
LAHWLRSASRSAADPEECRAVVHRPGSAAVTLNDDDMLDLDAAVRGFAVRVSEIFD